MVTIQKKVWKVRSFSNPNVKYMVTRHKDGVWSCTCPSHKWQLLQYAQTGGLKGKIFCKHIVKKQK